MLTIVSALTQTLSPQPRRFFFTFVMLFVMPNNRKRYRASSKEFQALG